MLTIVPTPIGNLEDITLRAIRTLTEVDFIIAENPLHTGTLLKHLGIPKKELVQLADHNEAIAIPKILAKLQTHNAALVSDAGTPAISDPGFKLVRACTEAQLSVESIPGPSAVTTALAGSGLPSDRFLFVGFLPKTEPKLLAALKDAEQTSSTLIIYESPQRIVKSAQVIAKYFPTAKVVVAREITKLHEEYIRGSAVEVAQILANRTSIKGEIVLLISFK